MDRTGRNRRGDAVVVCTAGRAASGGRNRGLAQLATQADLRGGMAQPPLRPTGTVRDRPKSMAVRGGKTESAMPVRDRISHRMAGISGSALYDGSRHGASCREREWEHRCRFSVGRLRSNADGRRVRANRLGRGNARLAVSLRQTCPAGEGCLHDCQAGPGARFASASRDRIRSMSAPNSGASSPMKRALRMSA